MGCDKIVLKPETYITDIDVLHAMLMAENFNVIVETVGIVAVSLNLPNIPGDLSLTIQWKSEDDLRICRSKFIRSRQEEMKAALKRGDQEFTDTAIYDEPIGYISNDEREVAQTRTATFRFKNIEGKWHERHALPDVPEDYTPAIKPEAVAAAGATSVDINAEMPSSAPSVGEAKPSSAQLDSGSDVPSNGGDGSTAANASDGPSADDNTPDQDPSSGGSADESQDVERDGDEVEQRGEEYQYDLMELHEVLMQVRYNVYLEKPDDLDFCHGQQRHGPDQDYQNMQLRDFDPMPPPATTQWNSQETIMHSRTWFLSENQRAMDERLATGGTFFSGTIYFDHPVGHGQFEYNPTLYRDIRTATFAFRFIDGKWYEVTAYPNLAADYERELGEGSAGNPFR